MPTLATPVFLAQLAATLFMTGLIWFVQIVHYPLFAKVGDAAFVPYARRHATLTGYVVGVPMLVELLTALAGLLPSLRPPVVSAADATCSALLVLLLWLTTGLVQVPLHEHLGQSRDATRMIRLVQSNWIRTAAWTLRSMLLIMCVHRAF